MTSCSSCPGNINNFRLSTTKTGFQCDTPVESIEPQFRTVASQYTPQNDLFDTLVECEELIDDKCEDKLKSDECKPERLAESQDGEMKKEL